MGAVPSVLSLLLFSVPLVAFPVHFSLHVVHKTLALSALAALGFGFALLENARSRTAAPIFPLLVPLSLYLGSQFLSLTQAVNLAEGGSRFLLSVTGVSLFWLVVNHAATPAAGARLLAFAALSGLLVSLIGIYQFWLGGIPGLEEILPPASTFGNKAMAAQFVILVLPLPFLFFLFRRDALRELLWGACGGVILTYLVYTRSRGAWAASLGALGVIALWLAALRKGSREERSQLFALTRRKVAILVAIGAFVTAMVMAPEYQLLPQKGSVEPAVGEVRSLVQPKEYATGKSGYRLIWWRNSLSMIRDHPFLGVGVGNWQYVYQIYARSSRVDPTFAVESPPFQVHNDYLQLWAEAGPAGLLAFFWILFALARRAWQGFPATGDRFRKLAILALSFALLSALAHAFVDFPFEMPTPTAFFWIFAGLLWAASSPPARESGRSRLTGLAVWGGLILVVALYTGLNLARVRADYHFALVAGYNWTLMPDRPQPLEQVKEVRHAIALYPFDRDYHLAEGILHLELGSYPEAVGANLRALRLSPYYVPAEINLGLAYMGLGRSDEAEAALKRALRIWPDSVGAHNNLGILYASLGRLAEAKGEFLEALRISPEDGPARNNLQLLLSEESRSLRQ